VVKARDIIEIMGRVSPKISIIVPVYGHHEKFKNFIESLRTMTTPPGGAELIIVDNHTSPRDYREFASRLAIAVRSIHEPKPGSYAARNAGAQAAHGELLAFTDADCLVDPNWLAHGVVYFDDGCDIVAGRIQSGFPDGKLNLAQTFGKALPFDQRSVFDRGEALTANTLVRKAVFEQTGGFNEALYSGGDLEWSSRASLRFQLCYADDSVIHHPTRSTLREVFEKRRRIVGGMVELSKIRGIRLPWVPWFLPPRFCLAIWRDKTLPIYRRAQLSVLRYILQLYGAWHRILLTLGRTKPSRA
jgi:glycosyltransferase involved in cell wall biosynthesis